MKYQSKPIAFIPQLVEILGDIPTALYYQQLLYWSDKGGRDDGWIYKSMKEIEYETTLSRKQQERARKNLEKSGIIKTKLMKADGAPTLHFQICTKLTIGFARKSQIQLHERAKSITENTTENTYTVGSGRRIPASKPKNFAYPQNFERLWSMYRKGDKWSAYRAYMKRSGEYTDEEIIHALSAEKKKDFAQRHFSTVLNGDLDELIHEKPAASWYDAPEYQS